jgi:hypothetical protein
MVIHSNHIIRRQYLHVELKGTESEGLALQRQLTGYCQQNLAPAFERVLDRCAPPDGHRYIERLEIDAGAITLENLEHDLADIAARAFEEVLRKQMFQENPGPEGIVEETHHKTERHFTSEAFIYFLKSGSLPWLFQMLAGNHIRPLSCC